MPTYEYKCEACGNLFEKFQSITAEPIRKCPKCGKHKVRRLIGSGAGLIFKGSGFYITDYRDKSYPRPDAAKPADGKPADAKPAETKAADAKPAETSAAAKPETPAAKPKPSKAKAE